MLKIKQNRTDLRCHSPNISFRQNKLLFQYCQAKFRSFKNGIFGCPYLHINNAQAVGAILKPAAVDVQASAVDVQASIVDVQASAVDVQASVDDVQSSAVDVQTSVDDVQLVVDENVQPAVVGVKETLQKS